MGSNMHILEALNESQSQGLLADATPASKPNRAEGFAKIEPLKDGGNMRQRDS